jgi:AmpE protein
MKLIALLLGLIAERFATQLFHLRELRWLDRLIDAGFRQAARLSSWPAIIPVVLLAVLLILPVLLIRISIGDTLYGFPYLVLAIIVLFFSLGPKDIGEEIDDYCEAVESGDKERIKITARALTEAKVSTSAKKRTIQVEEAVCVQANNRLFAVIFWFVVLGPVAAWAYRVVDLIRRRAVFNAERQTAAEKEAANEQNILNATSSLHALCAWVPARLTAIGYGLAGSFDGARSAWRGPTDSKSMKQWDASEQLLARVGLGALALHDIEGETATDRAVRGAMAANGLVFRLLLIWGAVIGAMTLYGLSV